MERILEYELLGAGGAYGAINVGGRRIPLDASFIYDTFGNIVEALLKACEGDEIVEWIYLHEPDTTHARLVKLDGRNRLTLIRYPDFRISRPRFGHPGQLIGEGEVDLRKLVGDVIIAGSRMLEKSGEDGYLKSWGRPFPVSLFARLKEKRRTL
jgi:hypothetical protein